MINFSRKKENSSSKTIIYIINSEKHISIKKYNSFIKENLKHKLKFLKIFNTEQKILFVNVGEIKKSDKADYKKNEELRKLGSSIADLLNEEKVKEFHIIDLNNNEDFLVNFLEGLALTNYQFLKYKKNKKELSNSLSKVSVLEKCISTARLSELKNNVDAVYFARDLVNEPLSYLTAEQMAKDLSKKAKTAGIKVEIYNKKKIESLKMGGVLAVNKGSIDPPTFTILEWKPKKSKYKKPLVLVGKGVVYDTGGLSLKPTANSMDHMKCDMGGAASVAGAIYAIAKNKLPIHVIALIPATDNRPGLNAYAPGDIVKMHNGSTVEVLNTDAEGRMLLADALSYAKKYKPFLVCDAATLTGSTLRAIGQKGVICMGNADDKTKKKMVDAGNTVYERLVEMPLWDEYAEMLKSTVADLKNIGGNSAGAITAGKFLEHFTDYPWMHFDIASMGWMYARDSYRTKDASGVGVRLFYELAKTL